MTKRALTGATGCILALGLLFLLAQGAAAREGFFLGAGLASQSMSGDIDGDLGFCSEPTCSTPPVVVPGELDPGGGLGFVIGYGFNENVAIEYLFLTTSHDATHNALPGETQSAVLASGLLGARLGAPVGDSGEFFGRIGTGGYVLEYEDATLTGGATFSDATFTGSGIGIGVGYEVFFDHAGLEIGYTVHDVTFEELDAGGVTGTIDDVDVTIGALHVLLVYHF